MHANRFYKHWSRASLLLRKEGILLITLTASDSLLMPVSMAFPLGNNVTWAGLHFEIRAAGKSSGSKLKSLSHNSL